jgi:N-acyl amino acid synthase FeeM
MVAVAVAARSGFVERVSQFLSIVEYRRADSDPDREAIYRLRYDAYRREGTISAAPERRLTDSYDEADNALIFGLYVGGELASSIRLTVASDEYPNLPALQVFGDILTGELERGKIIVDPTRFVANHRMSRLYPELPHATVRLAWAATEYFQADLLLATVRTEHQAYYRRMFEHHVICEARPYPMLIKPISLMWTEYPAAREQVLDRYPFFATSMAERRALFEVQPALVRGRVAAA